MNDTVAQTETAEKAKKSIVPAKYSGKYKEGGDAVSQFIKAQTEGQFASLAALCRKNGVSEEQVTKYEGLVADKANNHGIEGRARMTLGNMVRSIARKSGKLVALNGEEVEFDLPKPAVSGAAAAAQTQAAESAPAEPAAETAAEDSAADTEATE